MPSKTTDQQGRRGHDIDRHGSQRGKNSSSPDAARHGGVDQSPSRMHDCHNRHRVTKNRLFNANLRPRTLPKHNHATGIPHRVGRDQRDPGVETVTAAPHRRLPTNFDLREDACRRQHAVNSDRAPRVPVCLKCHRQSYDTLESDSGGGTLREPTDDAYTNQAWNPGAGGAPGEITFRQRAYKAGPARIHQTVIQTNNPAGWHPGLDNTGPPTVSAAPHGVVRAPWEPPADVRDPDDVLQRRPWFGQAAEIVVAGGEDGIRGPPVRPTIHLRATDRARQRPATALLQCHEPKTYSPRTAAARTFLNSDRGKHQAFPRQARAHRCSWCPVAVPQAGRTRRCC